MNEADKPRLPDAISTVTGIPLRDEPALGALTLPGFLHEVTSRFADREALVLHTPVGWAC
jgi:fatty-acyl-CoA synthase